jgi:hypothetical protein
MSELSMVNVINFTAPPNGDATNTAIQKFIDEFNQEIYPTLNQIQQGYIGTTAPANPNAGQTWINTSVSPAMLNVRDPSNANWIPLYSISNTASPIPPGGCALPFNGTFGGTSGKNPVDQFTNEVNASWQMCDGTNGTMDLQDLFIVGAGNLYPQGATGGETTHLLVTAEIPSHLHSTSGFISGSGSAAPQYSGGSSGGTLSGTGSAGGGGAHNNMPPYYALSYIQRIS